MHITTISFNLPLSENEIPVFKKAILNIEGISQEWYNNKVISETGEEKNLVRYPPIQFRVLDGYATLWAINEGAKILEADLKSKKLLRFFWNGQERSFRLIRHFTNASETADYLPDTKSLSYRLCNYLPLTSNASGNSSGSSHQQYKQARTFVQKIKILEKVITSHLVLFSYAAGWKLNAEQKLKVELVDITSLSAGVYKKGSVEKEKHFKKFDLIIRLNARLPDGIALGSQVSLGYGVLQQLEE